METDLVHRYDVSMTLCPPCADLPRATLVQLAMLGDLRDSVEDMRRMLAQLVEHLGLRGED
jgi:hypothetical protein